MGNLVIIYDAANHVLSKEKIDLQNHDVIADKLDYIGDQQNMYSTKNLGIHNGQKIVVFYNDRIDWGDKKNYTPIGFKGEVFNNVIVVAAFNSKNMCAEDINMTTNEAFAEISNFESCEFGWEVR